MNQTKIIMASPADYSVAPAPPVPLGNASFGQPASYSLVSANGGQVFNGTSSAGSLAGVTAAPPSQCEATCACSCDPCCEIPAWRFFGEYLLLRPRDAGVDYAVPINGPIVAGAVPLQIGPTASVDPQLQSGFSVGFERVLDQCSSIGVSYTYYRNDGYDSVGPATVNTPFVLQSMVFNPSSADAATTFASASAHEGINFNLVDLDYHHCFWDNECGSFNYLVGVGYAQLGQEFDAKYTSIISAAVNTNVEFDGFGLRLGLDGEQKIGGGLFVAAKTCASLLGGQFGASYLQSDTNDPRIAATTWHDARFAGILESEVAIGWQGCNGHVRASLGYTLSDWLNVVRSSDFISSVQVNQYSGANKVGDTSLIFDGLSARAEFAW
jgi:hypothetical protein